ncbi:MAG: transporter substrate-binding domain-containing protein [Clostridiales bacterium]|jgi:putative glutamine transport system substrate-binding protein|nr:transporter substrate-binding domain-containing protein [Clostridiales bacterium]
MKKCLLLAKKYLLLACLTLILLSGCGQFDSEFSLDSSDSPGAEIIERGAILVGVKVDAPRMSSLIPESNEFEGFEVDVAKLLGEKIFGDANKTCIKPVTPQNRIDKLNEGWIDCTIGTFTINEDRKKLIHFSEPYYEDHLAFLVRRADRMTKIEELNGKIAGLAVGTAPTKPLPAMIEERGLNINVVEYPDYPILKGALLAGDVDAFCTVRAALFGYVDDYTEVMEEAFNPIQYGIALKLGNQQLWDYLNNFVTKLQSDGTLDQLKQKWNV